MPLSLAQIYDVCLATDTNEKCCRYLSQDSDTLNYHCLKKSLFKKEIDDEIDCGIKMQKDENSIEFAEFHFFMAGLKENQIEELKQLLFNK